MNIILSRKKITRVIGSHESVLARLNRAEAKGAVKMNLYTHSLLFMEIHGKKKKNNYRYHTSRKYKS